MIYISIYVKKITFLAQISLILNIFSLVLFQMLSKNVVFWKNQRKKYEGRYYYYEL